MYDTQREYDVDIALMKSQNTQTLILKIEDKKTTYNTDDFGKDVQDD